MAVKLLAMTVPASSWKVPELLTSSVEVLPAPVTLTVVPLTTSQPLLAARLPTVPPVPVRVRVPAPTLLSVPLPLIRDPAKFVLTLPKPTCTVLVPTLSWPEPLSRPMVPSFWKFTRPVPLTVTAVTLVIAVTLAQLNTPPLATARLVLPSNWPLTVRLPPLTSVSPV